MKQNKTPEELTMPWIVFSLDKAGEIDEKFYFKSNDPHALWSKLNSYEKAIDTYLANVMAAVHKQKRRQGFFTTPFLIRWALIGHDGRRLYLSLPDLMEGCFAPAHKITDYMTDYDSVTLHIHIIHGPYFSLRMFVDYVPDRWSDTVKSIDIYVSPQGDPYISDNCARIEPDASSSPFYRVASIDTRQICANTGFVSIPLRIASTYTPDLEGNGPPIVSPEMETSTESKNNQEVDSNRVTEGIPPSVSPPILSVSQPSNILERRAPPTHIPGSLPDIPIQSPRYHSGLSPPYLGNS